MKAERTALGFAFFLAELPSRRLSSLLIVSGGILGVWNPKALAAPMKEAANAFSNRCELDSCRLKALVNESCYELCWLLVLSRRWMLWYAGGTYHRY
jgi:hypothetical protein